MACEKVLDVCSFIHKPGFGDSRFLHVSTDEVYGSLGRDGYFTENAICPNSPYSASKASADFIVRSFVNVLITIAQTITAPSNIMKINSTLLKMHLRINRFYLRGRKECS